MDIEEIIELVNAKFPGINLKEIRVTDEMVYTTPDDLPDAVTEFIDDMLADCEPGPECFIGPLIQY